MCIRDRSSTTILSAYCTELMRWAMMMTVVPFRLRLKDSRISPSVVESTAGVESARMRMAGCLSRARAMHRRCF